MWNAFGKRCFDVVVAGLSLIVLSPVFAAVALVALCDRSGPIFFKQWRVGKGFRPFEILKFRTMVADAAALGGSLTLGEHDPRITPVGRFLRKYKLDELPQLINVLRGEMSLVGPRPEVERYVNAFRSDYALLLTVRPGITDLASLAFCDEAVLLSATDDPNEAYLGDILPQKIALSRTYVNQMCFWLDVQLILRTLLRIMSRAPSRGAEPCTN